MAPNNVKVQKDKRIVAALAFAESLQARIASKAFDDASIQDLRSQIKQLPFTPSPTLAARSLELDARGLELWNATTRLRLDHGRARGMYGEEENGTHPSLVTGACLTRVFAFLLLEASWHVTAKASQGRNRDQLKCFHDTVRIIKVALKAGKMCVAQEEAEVAIKVLERAAVLAEELSNPPKTKLGEDDARLAEKLTSGYYVLRTTLAWKQSRLDIAEHMYAKAELSNRRLDPSSVEELADTLFEMGRDLLRQKQNEVAVRWLERAYDVLSCQELQDLSMDAADLRVSILQTLFKALLGQRTAETKRQATDYLNLMEQDYPEKLVVLLLKLDLLLSGDSIDGEQYYSLIVRMVRSIPLTPVNLKTMLYHVHKLKTLRSDLTATVLDELLRQRLLTEPDKDDWIEKVLVTRVWLVYDGTGSNEDGTSEELQGLFDDVLHALRQPVSVAATHGVQTLLWRRIEAAYTSNQFVESSRWGQLSLHSLLGNCGEINKSRIARKRILCALSMQDFDAARQIFYEMTEAGKMDPLSRFLMFKLALRTGDDDFAEESLDLVSKASSNDATLLYACVVEAQTLGDKRHAALALRGVLGQYDPNASKGVNLPALLRCMVRLLSSELHDDRGATEQEAEELCKVFEAAVGHAKKQLQAPGGEAKVQDFNEYELQWFARSSYNLALRLCTHVHPGHLVRLVHACTMFLGLLQNHQAPEDTAKELQLRSVHCFWLMACAQVTIARAEDNVDVSTQAYLAVRTCGTDFRNRLPILLNRAVITQDERDDLLEKNFQLVKFELEAALKLRQWAAMDELFEQCWAFDGVASIKHWETLADLVLVIHAEMVEAKSDPSQLRKILVVLQTIINKTERTKPGDTAHLAHWLRCLFQIASGFDETACLQCLEQAHAIAGKRRGTSRPYPTVELEWLATTAFNRAVDHYCASDDVRTRLWAEKALMLAGDAEDGGSLHALLRDKYSGLSWD